MNLPSTGSRGSGHRWSGQIAPQHGWERLVHFCGSKERAVGHLARTDGKQWASILQKGASFVLCLATLVPESHNL